MGQDILVEDYLKNRAPFIPIDVRSEREFQENHLPGAVNIPLLTNDERTEVGTIYKQIGKNEAKWRAMELVSPKLPNLLSEVKHHASSDQVPLIYCWRGGMRSQAITHFAHLAGLEVQRLSGGYRAFRNEILKQIPQMVPEKAIILYGMTGTKKTTLLHSLQERGYPIIDLEGLANHKGSLFGSIDGRMPSNQKSFDAQLYVALERIQGSSYFIVEGESKRIGHVVQPEVLLERRQTGTYVHIQASLPTRIQRIHEEYVTPNLQKSNFIGEIERVLPIIMKKIKDPDIRSELEQSLQIQDFHTFIKLLLVYYYDPSYQHKSNQYINKPITIHSDSVSQAIEEMEELLSTGA